MTFSELEINPNTYYTAQEAASLLRISRRAMVRLLEQGVSRGLKIGRQWRVLGRDLLEMTRSTDEITGAQLVRSLATLSKPAFARVWDNDEDAVYDSK